ncbi:MAG: hypothetical protein WCH86_03925 [Kiritimatiellales bacterium]
MKKLLVTAAVLLPQLALLLFWIYARSSIWLPLWQMSYNALIGPFLIGIYGGWEIIQKNESAWKVTLFCLLLIMLIEFTGYANWGLSTGLFFKPDTETLMLQFFECVAAVITTGFLLILFFAVRRHCYPKRKNGWDHPLEINENEKKMKKPLFTAVILLPQLALLLFWIYASSDSWPSACQFFYNGLIGPFLIGTYGGLEIIKKKESAWKVTLFCLLLIMLVEFTGYVNWNWGLSDSFFLKPTTEILVFTYILSGVAIMITGFLLILSFTVRGLKRGQKGEKGVSR